jgi:CRISPR-associated protein Cas2
MSPIPISDFYVISYDIEENQRRNKVANTLKNYGDRVQKSVFELVNMGKHLPKIVKILETLIDKNTDSIRIYRLCVKCVEQISIVGIGSVSQDQDVFIV